METTIHERDFLNECEELASDFITDFAYEIVENYLEYKNLGDDSYYSENWVNESITEHFDLQESAELLSQLSNYKEIDSGLWEGLEPQEAISAQAHFTMINCIRSLIVDKLDSIDGVEVTNLHELREIHDGDDGVIDILEEQNIFDREKIKQEMVRMVKEWA